MFYIQCNGVSYYNYIILCTCTVHVCTYNAMEYHVYYITCMYIGPMAEMLWQSFHEYLLHVCTYTVHVCTYNAISIIYIIIMYMCLG